MATLFMSCLFLATIASLANGFTIDNIASETPLKFLVVGDWGRKALFNQSVVASQMGKVAEKVDTKFVVSTGDNFYEDGLMGVEDLAFNESFIDIYKAKSLQVPWYSCLGNHDYRGDVLSQIDPVMKARDPRWNCHRSFTVKHQLCSQPGICRSSVEIFFIDTTPFVKKYRKKPNKHTYDWRGIKPRKQYIKEQVKELGKSLRASRATWKIVVGHHPIRSVGHHGDTAELHHTILPVIKANKIDAYINGHDHCLQHIKSVDSDIHYLTSGGGSKAWAGIDENADMKGLQLYYDGQGFILAEITPTVLSATFYNIDGVAIHQLNLSKK